MPAFEYAPGVRLCYRDTSAARDARPAVLLLHGLGVTGRSWQPQIPPLVQAGFRALAVDLPGFGGSTTWCGREGPAGMDRLATPVLRLLDALELEQVALVGLSMGGAVTLQLALDHPERVERMILANTFARLVGGAAGAISAARANPAGLRLWPYYLYRYLLVQTLGLGVQASAVSRRLFPQPAGLPQRVSFVAQVLQADPAAYRATMRLLARFNVEPRLNRIDPRLAARTLVVTAAEDTIVAPAVQHRLAQGLPGARHIIIPSAGHAVTAEQPQAFNHIMIEFLKSGSDNHR